MDGYRRAPDGSGAEECCKCSQQGLGQRSTVDGSGAEEGRGVL